MLFEFASSLVCGYSRFVLKMHHIINRNLGNKIFTSVKFELLHYLLTNMGKNTELFLGEVPNFYFGCYLHATLEN